MSTDGGQQIKPFSSARGLSRIVVILLIALVPIYAISAYTSLDQYVLLKALEEDPGFDITIEEAEMHDLLFNVFSYLQLIWYPTLALFLIWFYKMYRNLPSLGGTGLAFRTRSLIAFFFIPIVSLWKPYNATEEIWKVSDPSVVVSDRARRKETSSSTILVIWWIFWVISNLVGWYALRQSFTVDDSTESLIRMDSIYLVSEILTTISVLLTVFIVSEIDKRQSKKIILISNPSNFPIDGTTGSKHSDDDGQGFQNLKP